MEENSEASNGSSSCCGCEEDMNEASVVELEDDEMESSSSSSQSEEQEAADALSVESGIVIHHYDEDGIPTDIEVHQRQRCCKYQCWFQPMNNFWGVFFGSPKCVRPQFARVMKRLQSKKLQLSFGVDYDCTQLVRDSRYDSFDDQDYYAGESRYFGGLQVLQGGGVPNNNNNNNNNNGNVVDDHLSRFLQLQHDQWYSYSLVNQADKSSMKAIFGSDTTTTNVLPTVQEVKDCGGTIVYDIVFGSGRYEIIAEEAFDTIHYSRTMKGTIELSIHADDPNKLVGKVVFDRLPAGSQYGMDLLPVGNFNFLEQYRMERIESSHIANSHERPWDHKSSSVLFLSAQEQILGNATGEIRISKKKKTPHFLKNASKTSVPDSIRYHRNDAIVLEHADVMMRNYQRNRCLWIKRHMKDHFPIEIIEKIADFVSPPPVFYTLEGDIVLTTDWGNAVREKMNGNKMFGDPSATSTIIARRRRRQIQK